MFFKRNPKIKKRIVCGIHVVMDLIAEIVRTDGGGIELVFLLGGKQHRVGFESDYDRNRGFFDPIFFLDEQKFITFESFTEKAVLDGQRFAVMVDEVEIIGADRGEVSPFPFYVAFEGYVTD